MIRAISAIPRSTPITGPNGFISVEFDNWMRDVTTALSGGPDALTFATLPDPVAGMTAYITDSSTAVWGAVVAGGGANRVLVFYNGTAWTVAGA